MKPLLLLALMLPALAGAEVTPDRGPFDSRVRIVNYNPANVVRLSTFYGVSTHVQFGDGEIIKDIAMGDDQAWKVASRGSHLFIKPQADKADTNLTVVTNRRVYQFALVLQHRSPKDERAWSDDNLIFSLSFRYPDEEAREAAAKAKEEEVKARLADTKAALGRAQAVAANSDYWVAGSESISPTAARDDGRFIYLTFSHNRDMPAVYAIDEAGNESLVNTNVDGNTIVVQRMVRQLTLRKGPAVACVVNRSFDLDSGKDNTTGTVSPDVQRIIKGAP